MLQHIFGSFPKTNRGYLSLEGVIGLC